MFKPYIIPSLLPRKIGLEIEKCLESNFSPVKQNMYKMTNNTISQLQQYNSINNFCMNRKFVSSPSNINLTLVHAGACQQWFVFW